MMTLKRLVFMLFMATVFSATVQISCSAAELLYVYINPSSLSLNVGQTGSLSLVKVYDDFSEYCCVYSGVQWQSYDTSVASVSMIGEVQGISGGNTTIQATYQGYTAQAFVTVNEPRYLTGIRVEPYSLDIKTGEVQSLRVYKLYSDWTEECCAYSGVSWQSFDTSVAIVSMIGEVQGKNAGTTQIQATYQGFTDYAFVTVTAPRYVTDIRIVPSSLSLNVGTTGTLSVYKVYNDNTEECCSYSGVLWQSLDTSVAAVSMIGEVQGKAAGTTQIQASYQGLTDQAFVTVIEPRYMTGIRLVPSSLSMDVGITKTFSLYKVYNDNTEECCLYSSVLWQSMNTSVAVVSMIGEVQGRGAGTTQIQASYQNFTVTGQVTVTEPKVLSGIRVEPTAVRVNVGEIKTLRVVKRYSDGTEECCAYSGVIWQSSNTSIAAVSMIGEVQGLSPGNANISVTYQGFPSEATIYVISPTMKAKPPTITGGTVSGKNVTLNWTAVTTDIGDHPLSGTVLYTVYRTTGYVPSPIAFGVQGTTYTDENTIPGTNYIYYVTTFNQAQESDYSNAYPITVPLGEVPAPSGLTAVEDAPAIRLNWQPVPVTNVFQYCIERSEPGKSPISLGCHPKTDPPEYRDETVTPLNPGETRTYTYSVWAQVWMFALAKDGAKASVQITFRGTEDSPPGPVKNFRAVIGANSITLKWDTSDADEDVNGYRLNRPGWAQPIIIGDRLTNSYNDAGLSPGEYTYTIEARDSKGRFGVPVSKMVDFTGGTLIRSFSVTPEIDPTCSDSQYPPIATIKFSLAEPSNVNLSVTGAGYEFPLMIMAVVPKNVEAEMYWPPDRCDGPPPSKKVLPGEYMAKLEVETLNVSTPEPYTPPEGQVARIATKSDSQSKPIKVNWGSHHTVNFVSGTAYYSCPDKELKLEYRTSPFGLPVEWFSDKDIYLSDNNLPVSISTVGTQQIWACLKYERGKNGDRICDVTTIHIKGNNTTGGGTTTCPGIPESITVPILNTNIRVPRSDNYYQSDCDWCTSNLATCGYASAFTVMANSVADEVARRYAIKRGYKQGTKEFDDLYKCLREGGAPDAFRHMYWQYLLADSVRFSREGAAEIGNRHENHGTPTQPNNCSDMTMDLSNNWIGREFAGYSVMQGTEYDAIRFFTGDQNPNVLLNDEIVRTLIDYVDIGRAVVIKNCGVTGLLSDIYE
jgi:hypothetical protein